MLEKNPENHTDPMWQTHMQILTKRMKNMEVKQIIDDALFEYYSERGMEVPNWRMRKNPQWWIDYLRDLGLGENNE
jgi:hypothetical protein